MKGLIAKLEAATEGSRELDVEIAKRCMQIPAYAETAYPRYTRSLDPVRESAYHSWEWSVSKSVDGQHTACFIVKGEAYPAMAATPELAFCAAWLKAVSA